MWAWEAPNKSFGTQGHMTAILQNVQRVFVQCLDVRFQSLRCSKSNVFLLIYPLVICYIAIENGHLEIVDLPIKNGDFPVRYVHLPESSWI